MADCAGSPPARMVCPTGPDAVNKRVYFGGLSPHFPFSLGNLSLDSNFLLD